MAQLDFCFTYYDTDASKDKAHMNRLERGAYDDIISAQRKFGRLDLKLIEKILSHDFESCWYSLKLILKCDSDGKYYIAWLETSIAKSMAYSKKQSDRRLGKSKTTMDVPRKDLLEDIEDEDENIEIRATTSVPFGVKFKEVWDLWKRYKFEQHKFKYKSQITEQAALDSLYKTSKGKEVKAVLMIYKAMENGWKGFHDFELVDANETNGKLEFIGRNKKQDISEFLKS